MEENKLIAFIQNHWKALGLILTGLVLFYVVSQISFIKVEVTNGQDQADYSYFITPQQGGSTNKATSKQATYRKLVRKGSYVVETNQSNSSYFELTTAGGFFTTKTVKAELKSEQSREFIGDNPDACMSYIDGRLLSYSCNGERKTVKAHMPAGGEQPTYAKETDASGDVFEGLATTQQGTIVLINSGSPDLGSPSLYTAKLDNNGKTSIDGRYMDMFGSSDSYGLKSYKDGFIVYDAGLYTTYYMSSVGAQPERINNQVPKDTSLNNYLVATNNNTIAAAYTNQSKNLSKNVHDEEGLGGSSTIAITGENQNKQIDLPGVFDEMEVCGTQKLCVLHNKTLEIYDISGKKPKLLDTMSGVQSIGTYNNHLLIVTEQNILDMDVDSMNGYVAYSFGDYQFCGLQTDLSGYTLCAINNLERKVALRFDPTKANSTNIDKKVAKFQKSTGVLVVSAYKNYIFIAPNYGQQAYNPATKIYDYEPATVKRMNAQIEQDLTSIGIDRSVYRVSGTQQP